MGTPADIIVSAFATPPRDDLRAIQVPATEMANDLGSTATASVIMLAVYAAATGVVRIETLEEVIPHALTRKDLIEVNLNAVQAGADFVRQLT